MLVLAGLLYLYREVRNEWSFYNEKALSAHLQVHQRPIIKNCDILNFEPYIL